MKYLLSFFLIILLAAVGVAAFMFFEPPDYNRLNLVQRYVAKDINKKFTEVVKSLPKDRRTIVDYDKLINSLNFIDKNFAKRIFNIDPAELGFEGPFYSMAKPFDLVKIQSKKLGDGRVTGVQYCPEHSYKDYMHMVNQMQKDIGKKLLIDSGYRSPGRQAYLFFHYLAGNNFSLRENAKWIAMPGYSQHGDPVYTAIDFTNEQGINGFSDGQTAEDFAKLPEFAWMMEYANKYHFYLSYPKNNKWGVEFEPWHWHWEKK